VSLIAVDRSHYLSGNCAAYLWAGTVVV
jgi:hypothetical protein